MSSITVGRWGHNLAVRLPGGIARSIGLREGEQLEIEAQGSDILIRRPIPPLTLAEMFRDRSAGEWRAAYAGSFDWGPDVGREIVEE